MRYCKAVSDNYISAIGTGSGGTEITESEYNSILEIIHNRPAAPDGYGYRLTENLKWELYELPAAVDDPELTAEEALDIILGGDSI